MSGFHRILKRFLAALSLASAAVIAAEDPWYADFGGGRADLDGARLTGDDRFLRAAVGRYVMPWIALEGAWIDLGEVRDSAGNPDEISLAQDTLAVRGRGFAVGPVLRWCPVEVVEISLRLGVSVLDVDRRWSGGTVVDPALAADDGGTHSDFFAGARIAGQLTGRLSLGLNLDRYELEQVDVDATYVDLRIRF